MGYRSPVWQIETLGPPDRWTPEALDRLAATVSTLTLYDHPRTLPLPLWYAKRFARVPEKLLYGYRAAMTQVLREQTVDQAWLEGVEDFDQETAELDWEQASQR